MATKKTSIADLVDKSMEGRGRFKPSPKQAVIIRRFFGSA
jgi:hypothetical protein